MVEERNYYMQNNKTMYQEQPSVLSFQGLLEQEKISNDYFYEGNDLGNVYHKESTKFRVWAPTASDVKLNLYKEGMGDNLIETHSMELSVQGTWTIKIDGDLDGVYYTYLVTHDGITREAVDPYVRTTGANGKRGMVLNLENTNPVGWREDYVKPLDNVTDTVIYELHLRDLSTDEHAGIEYVGKFLQFKEENTKNKEGYSTGLDHIKELGITHLHLLPVYDYASVDETDLAGNQFNWGYDPDNYNVPEGSYSTDPYHGEVRVKEMKKMVQCLHRNNIHVVMDVVYNHTYSGEDSNFNKIVPNYYYRQDDKGFSDASGCGNETASERAMVRKFIVDSVVYWAKEYHIDGFRFDLMGIHDIETMNEIRKELDKINPGILLYGEGWTCAASPLDESLRAMKINTKKLNGIAAFNDDIRDAVKGSVFNPEEKGFVNGALGFEELIKFGVVGATSHKEVMKHLEEYHKTPWSGSPKQSINYVSAHDNYTLWDKLTLSCQEDSLEDRIAMNKLASAIVFTSQGIPFLQAGEELLRSKENEDGTLEENSYKSSDYVNRIQWENKTKYHDVYLYYKGLIEFRKSHEELRMDTKEAVEERLHFIDGLDQQVVSFTIKNQNNDDLALQVIYNASKTDVTVPLDKGTWDVYVNESQAGNKVLDTIDSNKVVVKPISCMVLVHR